ncbi:MAG: polysaccharide deacetylase family protein [Bacteriovoracaceae bacterium]|jgi:peptidoglycan/xylan/chitin deacetylase (PgdA/CDA1 family)|nr:polysaccharide deacetylase family protein [Bacteriovoracaceae bacterium]
MKILFLLFICVSAFSISLKAKYDFAHIYADSLLSQFDQSLNDLDNPLQSTIYKKLLKTREYIEELGFDPNIKNEKYLIEIEDASEYNKVVRQINRNEDIFVYPSITRAGNVTGNTFPQNVWSLTFDDGPRGDRTKAIVDNLYERGLKATFFMLTREVKKYLATAQYVKDAKMEIALHSYTHKSLANPSSARLKYEITQAKIDLEKILDVKLDIFRLPYGAGLRNSSTREVIADNKLIHIFWNIDTLDWKDKDSNSVFNRVKKQMKKTPNHSGVILFHDIQAPTVKTSEMVMDYLVEKNQTICTIGEVISYLNNKDQSCVVLK